VTRLLGDSLRGGDALFSREDGVEAAWQVVEPDLRNPAPLSEYVPGSWGRRRQSGLWRWMVAGTAQLRRQSARKRLAARRKEGQTCLSWQGRHLKHHTHSRLGWVCRFVTSGRVPAYQQ
jgi:hypothetical protein